MSRTPARFAGGTRAARAVAVAAAILLGSAAGHAAGGGHVADPLGLLLAAVLAGAIGVAVWERRRRLIVLFATIVGAQALIHVVLLVSGGHHPSSSGSPSALRMTGCHLAASTVLTALLATVDGVVDRWGRFWRQFATDYSLVPVPVRSGGPLAPVSLVVGRQEATACRHSLVRRGPPLSLSLV